MREIPLWAGHGHARRTIDAVALVDEADFEAMSAFQWRLTVKGYAVRTGDTGGARSMARQLMNAPAGMQVDHANGNRLDNRRANLRLCTPAQNSWNRGSFRNSTTGVRGVKARGERWAAEITREGVLVRLGTFDTKEEAVAARQAGERCLYGAFAPKRQKIA